jgi:conjugative transposon TraN protein
MLNLSADRQILKSTIMQNSMNIKTCSLRQTVLLIALSAFIAMQAKAQIAGDVLKTETLEITFYKTTSIIFPAAIKNVDRGSRDILAQKARGVENILQLKAGRKDFSETNLTVITADGELHHFMVSYSSRPKNLIIDADKTKLSKVESSAAIFTSRANKQALAEYANNILSAKRRVRFVSKRDNKINLSLQGIYIHDNTIFYHLKVKNRSNIDYDIDFLRCYIRDKKQVKRTASQEVKIKPVYVHGDTKKPIKGQSEIDLVYALKKFTIPDAKHLAIELFEENGGRNLELLIKNRMIVNAKPVPGIQENSILKEQIVQHKSIGS